MLLLMGTIALPSMTWLSNIWPQRMHNGKINLNYVSVESIVHVCYIIMLSNSSVCSIPYFHTHANVRTSPPIVNLHPRRKSFQLSPKFKIERKYH